MHVALVLPPIRLPRELRWAVAAAVHRSCRRRVCSISCCRCRYRCRVLSNGRLRSGRHVVDGELCGRRRRWQRRLHLQVGLRQRRRLRLGLRRRTLCGRHVRRVIGRLKLTQSRRGRLRLLLLRRRRRGERRQWGGTQERESGEEEVLVGDGVRGAQMLHEQLDVGAVELTAQWAAHVADARNESTAAAADVVRGA